MLLESWIQLSKATFESCPEVGKVEKLGNFSDARGQLSKVARKLKKKVKSWICASRGQLSKVALKFKKHQKVGLVRLAGNFRKLPES